MAKAEEFPEEGELVVCSVQTVKDFGVFVSLDEYENKEGFIHIRDVATGWVKYIRDHVREGQKIVCKVLGVDPSKGHIDLSLKSVNEHQRREKIQQWKNENKAEKLLDIVAEKLDKSLDECYEEFGWALVEEFGTLYNAFESASADPKALDEEGLEGDWKETFVEVAKENVTPPYVRIDGYVDITCPEPYGVDKIRESLLCGKDSVGGNLEIDYVGAPTYRLIVTDSDYKSAEDELKKAAKAIMSKMEGCEGETKFYREMD